jgi:hypothetical protein
MGLSSSPPRSLASAGFAPAITMPDPGVHLAGVRMRILWLDAMIMLPATRFSA